MYCLQEMQCGTAASWIEAISKSDKGIREGLSHAWVEPMISGLRYIFVSRRLYRNTCSKLLIGSFVTCRPSWILSAGWESRCACKPMAAGTSRCLWREKVKPAQDKAAQNYLTASGTVQPSRILENSPYWFLALSSRIICDRSWICTIPSLCAAPKWITTCLLFDCFTTTLHRQVLHNKFSAYEVLSNVMFLSWKAVLT